VKKYVVLDFETTGLDAGLKLDEPVQIGLLDSDGSVLMNQLVKPTVEIDKEASDTHGLTLEKLKDAPTFLQVFQELARHIDGKTVCIYNAAYDVRILLNAAHNAGVVFPKFEYECVMQRYAEAWKQPNGNGFKSVKLVTAVEQQGFIPLTAHDAIADCRMTLMLKQHLDAGQNIKTFDPNAPMIVKAVSLEKKTAKTGKDYASFKCHDGQTVNVFDDKFHLLSAKGWPIQQWLNKLSEGRTQELSMPILIRVVPNGNFINIAGVENECPHTNTAPAS
jgi:DNA polymerase III epsilon subunit-like protein